MTPTPPASDPSGGPSHDPSAWLIDTHAHVDAAGGTPSIAQPAAEPTSPPVAIVGVTNLPRHYRRLQTIKHPRLCWTLGLHPAQPHPTTTLDEFLQLLPGCDAVGEIGLDASTTGPHAVAMPRQRDELEQILNHPETAKRMVTMHSRRATKPVIEHLKQAQLPGAVLHWFTGTPKQAQAAADAGAYFSINARMARSTDLIKSVPRDRVLLETDAPYTGKTSRPGDVASAVLLLADTWGTTVTVVEDTVVQTQQTLIASLDVDPLRAIRSYR